MGRLIAVSALFLLRGVLLDAAGHSLLRYGTYLGGRHKDSVNAIAVDSAGNAYVGGQTLSPDFPSTRGAFLTQSGVFADDYAGFIAKISPDGHQLVYATFLRGNSPKSLLRTFVNAVAVDRDGNCYVAGSTCSNDFPTTPAAFQAHAHGTGSDLLQPCDAFVAKLDPTGSRLLYATYLGGTGPDSATSIWVDSQGSAYVGGYTASPDFPVTPDALQPRHNGKTDGFLVKLDSKGQHLLYSTFLGGAENDSVAAVIGDSSGNVYVAGTTQSDDFPMIRRRHTSSTDADGFLLQFPKARTPSGLRIGGSGDDAATAVALSKAGQIYVTGWTGSNDFPWTANALQRRFGGGKTDAFWMRVMVNAAGKLKVVYSSLLGGKDDDEAHAIAVSDDDSVFIAGRTASSNFPTTRDALHRDLNRNDDGFLIRARESEVQFGTYIGGGVNRVAWHNDGVSALAVGPDGDLYVAGGTISDRQPVTPGSVQSRPAGNTEGFVLRLGFHR